MAREFSTTELVNTVTAIENDAIRKGGVDWVDEDLLFAYFEELSIRVVEMEPEAVLWAIQRDMRFNFGDGHIRILCPN